MPKLKTLNKMFMSGYNAAQNLVIPNDQSYINLDALLRSTIFAKNSTEVVEFRLISPIQSQARLLEMTALCSTRVPMPHAPCAFLLL